MMPYTPTEEVARTNRIPTLTSASRNGTRCPNSITSGPNGITAYTKRAVTIEIAGASQYTITSTCAGMKLSLKTSLSPSASGCSRPNGPTRLGRSEEHTSELQSHHDLV